MLPVNSGGHTAYQTFVLENLRKYYPDPTVFAKSTWDIIERFWNLDLSYTDELLRSKYSVFGPKPRTPSCMQRSYLLSIDFKVHSLTDWAAQLKINPLYAILSGFQFGDTPGVGTFYDFLDRLWDSDSDNLSPHIHPVKKKKVKKPKQFPNRTVTSVMTLPETVFIMATTYICWLQQTRKVTFPYFLYLIRHPNMIPMDFWKLTFVSNPFFLSFMSGSGFWILLMMPCRIISIAAKTASSPSLT